MAQNSAIEWTETTWNPLTGCTKISPGCTHCYAERMSLRLQAIGQSNYANGFKLTLHQHMLEVPLRWKKPRLIFVNSMSDLFHKDSPEEFILQVFDVMRRASWHVFQVLTKRSDRLLKLSPKIDWPDNVWMGVSVEREDYRFRIDHLRQTEGKVRFLSLEPLLGPLGALNLDGIHWVIAGGESGPGARPMDEAWVTEIRDQCLEAEVPFFFKQWGGVFKSRHGRSLEGRTWDQMPRSNQDPRADFGRERDVYLPLSLPQDS
jgi:protein gp37